MKSRQGRLDSGRHDNGHARCVKFGAAYHALGLESWAEPLEL